MRKIKFRAWHKPSSKWWTHEETLSILMLRGRVEDGTADNKDGLAQHWIIEQWTGLTDREGVDIYEGDILKLNFGIPPTSAILVVEWSEDIYPGENFAAIVGWLLRGQRGSQSAGLSPQYSPDIEVIGNIHTHPEFISP